MGCGSSIFPRGVYLTDRYHLVSLLVPLQIYTDIKCGGYVQISMLYAGIKYQERRVCSTSGLLTLYLFILRSYYLVDEDTANVYRIMMKI